MSDDIERYYRFTSKARLEKAVYSLLGILEGIAIDGFINDEETKYLATWLLEQQEYSQNHPFDEILPIISRALTNHILSEDDHQDLVWLTEKFKNDYYYSSITTDIQRLHAILVGVAADGIITEQELLGLSDWIADHDHLRRCWPYDEIDSLITSVLADHKIDSREHALLLHFFSEFSDVKPSEANAEIEHPTLQGLCAVAPSVHFENAVFCFTGRASWEREELENEVFERGGHVSNHVTKSVSYLVIGADGNPCWAYACYGRKIEQAVKLRKQGYPLVLVHEKDFFDAINE